MNRRRIFPILSVVALSAAVLACGLPTPTISAPPAQPTSASTSSGSASAATIQPAPEATATLSQGSGGVPVSFSGTSFTIPYGLANGVTNAATTDIELPFINPSNGAMPNHARFTLNGYPLQRDTAATLVVFSAKEYAAYADLTAAELAGLKVLPDSTDQLPQALAVSNFSAAVKIIRFQNGRGIRYLTQIMSGPSPVDNQELFYRFEGLTSDGQTYVSAVFPISAAFLQADSSPNTAPPAGGIAFPAGSDMDLFSKYLGQVQDKLNSAAPDALNPNLAALDALVQSLKVVAP